MFERSFTRIVKKIEETGKVVIVGAGNNGRELAGSFLDHDICPVCFMDNDTSLHGLIIYGITVRKLYALNEDVFYVISVWNDKIRRRLKEQLKSLGTRDDRILCYFPHRSSLYHRELGCDEYEDEIVSLFKERHGTVPDLSAPCTYSEIINWEKLNVHDELRTKLADKVLAKKWAAEKLGSSCVTTTYGVWDKTEDIPYDNLPDKFVLKTNNGSGRNIIVEDKHLLNIEEANTRLNEWLEANFFFDGFETQYRDIKPCILAEEYLDGLATTVYDYNIFCFHGEPEYIWCIKGSHRPGCCASFYDKEWNMQPFSYGYPLDVYPAPKPNDLDRTLEMSRILSKGFEHVRVDLYDMPDGRVLFGEMTFSTWGGLVPFTPKKYDKTFGDLIKG